MSASPAPRVVVEGVWKRYATTLERASRYALLDSARALIGLRAAPDELRRDEFWSLSDVSFTVAPGEGLAVCGRNGAGKSTLLKLLAGVITPDRGGLRVRGRVLSLLLVGAGFHPLLTGRENVLALGGLLGLDAAGLTARMPEIEAFSGLEGFLDTPVKFYSSGMSLRLAFAVAACSQPDVLLVDEALAVGDQGFRERCLEHLGALKVNGTTLIIASHSAGQLRRLTDRALWLDRGRVAAVGTTADILDRYTAAVERDAAFPLAPASPPSVDSAPADQRLTLAALHVDGSPADRLRLVAHQETRLVATLHVEGDGPGAPWELRAILEPTGGGDAAEALVDTRSATFPRPVAGTTRLDLRLRAHVAAGAHTLRLQLRPSPTGRRPAPPAPPAPLLEIELPCEVADAEGRGPVQADLRLVAGDAEAPTDPLALIRGQEVAASGGVTLAPGAPPPARARWALLASDGREVTSCELPWPGGAASAHVLGSWRAHLPPGTYRERVVAGAAEVLGAPRHVADALRVDGPVDLAGWVWRWPGDVLPGARASLSRLVVRAQGGPLDALWGGRPRLDAALSGQAAPAPLWVAEGDPLQIDLHATLEPGEYRVRVAFRAVVDGADRAVEAEGAVAPDQAGTALLRLALPVRLAPGEYDLDVTLATTRLDGTETEVARRGCARCHVVGPPRAGAAAVEVLAAEEHELPPDGPMARGRPIVVGALEELTLEEGAPGGPQTLGLIARFSEATLPSLKVSWFDPGGRRAAGLLHDPSERPLSAVPAGGVRRYVVTFRSHLGPGVYRAEAALRARRQGAWTVVDGHRDLGAVSVGARGRARGRRLLDLEVALVPGARALSAGGPDAADPPRSSSAGPGALADRAAGPGADATRS